ncbi:hypothetical protein O162_36745, partial [Pseudomonas putida SJ3]
MTRPRVRLGDLSVGFVQPLTEALRELGHDPEPLLRRYGLGAPRLAEAGARLSIPPLHAPGPRSHRAERRGRTG